MVYSTPQANRMDNADIASMKDDVATPEGIPDHRIGMSMHNVKDNFPVRSLGKGPANMVNADSDGPNVGNTRNGNHKNNLHYQAQAERILKPDEKNPSAFPCQNIGRIIKLLQNDPPPGDGNRDEQSSCCCSKKQLEFSLDATISPLGKNNAIDTGILSRLPVENDQAGTLSIPLSEKLESTDENDVGEAVSQNDGGAVIKFAESESSSEVKSEFIHGTQNQWSNLIPIGNHSPKKNGFLQSHWGVKERALFDANAYKRLLKGKSNLNECAESCNSAIVVKKRCRFDQELFVGGKKAKHKHNQPLSSGLNGQDSSFMNWISNVTKGLSRPTVDMAAPLSFAFCSPCNGPEEVVREHLLEQNMRYAGFKTFFQSIYLPSQNHPEVGLSLTTNEARSESPPTGRLNEVSTAGDDPSSCHQGIYNVGKQLLLLNKEFNESTSEIQARPLSLPPGVDV